MSTIDVYVKVMEQEYPYYYDNDVGVVDVVLTFRHVGYGNNIGRLDDFLNQIARSMKDNDGKIRITVDDIDNTKEQEDDADQGYTDQGQQVSGM